MGVRKTLRTHKELVCLSAFLYLWTAALARITWQFILLTAPRMLPLLLFCRHKVRELELTALFLISRSHVRISGVSSVFIVSDYSCITLIQY